jgi:small-conductance mechanosensitive channel
MMIYFKQKKMVLNMKKKPVAILILLCFSMLAPAAALEAPEPTQALVGDLEQTLSASLKVEENALKTYENRLEQANLSELDRITRGHLEDLQSLETAFSELSQRFDAGIDQRRAKTLFERQDRVFRLDAFTALAKEISLLTEQAKALVTIGFWENGIRTLWQSAGLPVLSIGVVLCGVIALLMRIRAALVRNQPLAGKLGPWTALALALVSHSVIPAGMAAALLIYSRKDTLFPIAPLFSGAAVLLLVFMAVKWSQAALAGPAREGLGGDVQAGRLMRLIRGAALFSVAYLPLGRFLGQDAALMVAFRLTGALWLLTWTLITWRHVRLSQGQTRARQNHIPAITCKGILILITGVTLVLDMTGFASLSCHWLVSWIKTAAIAFWWWVFLGLIREWDGYYREKSSIRKNDLLYDDYPVQWVLIRAGQFLWLITLAAALLLAWGNRQTVLDPVYGFLAHPLALGNMTFSLMGLIYAVLVILITYGATRVWKRVFQTKFLGKSGMDIGLQASITSISVYMIWAFGILVSLHVFGLNTASLAVVFGALGIGLGFGLQNIFNNFISGIILLFERPIQVGDDIEINGTWAQVKKINVRSTVVQTYDNASLIIPNADFISSQVTNWSFKDKRIRRNINVGVAYGSDIEQVRQSLLDIADKTPKVLKYPRPDVLFRDFGDSALLFRLRVWTDIDNMITVETAIRFEIDRVFKEQAIEISFPQQDIHIRSAPGLAPGQPPVPDPDLPDHKA